ncbi:hypothetical protein OTK49_03435 [Vibrio coralliirubri]|uniref:hypothetical protein n=1 Tax=Vibrio coralliirubri TaxID=1516159 RepID=UPI002283832E|nr:hypothetical protein [Vibrio coralliirubri]MCY9861570.1 hypothetical protein [Vibrio coralliirubri]
MGKKLFIAEKRHTAQCFIEAIGESNQSCDFVMSGGFCMWKRRLPKHLTFKDIPYSVLPPKQVGIESPSDYRLFGYFTSTIDGVNAGTKLGTTDEEQAIFIQSQVGAVKDALNSGLYSEVVFLIDPDPVGYRAAKLALESVSPPAEVPVFAIELQSLEPNSVRQLYKNRSPMMPEDFAKLDAMRLGQELKLGFDYLWNTNSTLVFGEAMKMCGLKPVPMSKYSLIALMYAAKASDGEAFMGGDLVFALRHWVGTGKYKQNDDATVGSARSVANIVVGLEDAGFLERQVDGRTVKVSEQARDFLALMHPKSLDLDLPFRVERWRQDSTLKAEVIKYINTYFGRQLRYQRKLTNK